MSAASVWFVLGVAFFLGELFSPVFIMVFFGLGAWAAGCIAALGGGLVPALAGFIFVSTGTLLLLRRVLVRTFKGRSRSASEDGTGGDGSPEFMLDGKLATVTRPITPQTVGEISVGGSFWRAVSEATLPEGATVRVLGQVKGNELLLRVVPHEAAEGENGPERQR